MDLTEKGEYVEYEPFLDLAAKPLKRLTAYYRFPSKDETAPSIDEMVEILDTIDAAISIGRKAYVHCLHGRGRTGTVVGCWLVRHGLNSNEVIAEITRLRQSLLFGAAQSSPRTPAQQEMVLNWKIGQ
jgi:protein-tyrosine phosphatase